MLINQRIFSNSNNLALTMIERYLFSYKTKEGPVDAAFVGLLSLVILTNIETRTITITNTKENIYGSFTLH